MGLMKRQFGTGVDNDLRLKPDEQDEFIDWMATPPSLREPRTYRELAERLDVGESTLYQWKKQPAVIDKVRARTRDVLGIDKLPKLIQGLFDIADDEGQPASARIQASKTLLEWYEKTTPKEKAKGSLEGMSLEEIQELAAEVWDTVESRKPKAVG